MDYSLLLIKGGKTVKVDSELYPFFARYQWSLNNSGYPSSSLGLLHHLCYGPRPTTGDICHLNDDKLDCRRENLSVMPHWLNQILTPKRAGRMKGISQLPSGSWKSEIQINGEKVYLGASKTYKEAVTKKTLALSRARELHISGSSPGQIKATLRAALKGG